MSYQYAVLGAGRQGTAAAYDLARHGDAARVVLADADAAASERACRRINGLLSHDLVVPARVDAGDQDALVALLQGIDGAVSAVPYDLNPGITRAAISAGAHLCDLGGNTALVRRQLELDALAREAEVSIIPDCGQVPGMGTSLMVFAMSLLEEAAEVRMWDGGIPQSPAEPWNYALTFHVGGLTNEYHGRATFLRDGRLVEVDCFDPAGYELIEFPQPFGRLEAFVTAGGTSTAPWTFAGKLRTLENRTLRYPGHAAQWKAFRDAGLLDEEEVEVDGRKVVPRRLLHALMAPRLEAGDAFRDAVLIRVLASGRDGGGAAEAQVDLIDRWDGSTGFTAMQRTTGWDAAIVCAMMARGQTPRGAVPRERSVDPDPYVAALRLRGFDLRHEVRRGGTAPARR